MKKLLLVGNFASFHLYNYAKNVVQYINLEVTAINTSGSINRIPQKYLDLYEELDMHLLSGPESSNSQGRFGSIKYRLQFLRILKSVGKVDYLHLHSVNNTNSLLLFFCCRLYRNIILTYWGSDLLRTSLPYKLQTLPLLKCASTITFMTEDMLDYYKKLPSFFQREPSHLRVMDFGDMIYEYIDSYKDTNIKSLKQEFGFNKEKITVFIGYNGSRQMQQEEVINALNDLSLNHKRSVQLVLPVLGIDADYRLSLVDGLKKVGIEFYLLDEFLDESRVAKLRKTTDIFILAQTTDALSNSMLESLYAGAIVINASWLRYSSLKNEGVYYLTFDSFDRMNRVLVNILNNYDQEKENCLINKEKIAKISSWYYLRDNWKNLYK